jgi:GLPGLI family protein
MKFLIYLPILLLSCFAKAQQGYNVTYKLTVEELPDFSSLNNSNRPAVGYNRLVCNDSVSFTYGTPSLKDPMKDSKAYGSKVFHHSIVNNFSKQQCFHGVAYQLPVKKRYFVLDSVKSEDWIFEDTIKTILGYKCRKAFLSTIKWIKVDTIYKSYEDNTIVWYAEEIKLPFGPLQYYGLPGLVLEVYDQRYMGRHILATSIKKESVSIIIPKDIKVVTAEEFRKRKN